jgi:hypothetical protein
MSDIDTQELSDMSLIYRGLRFPFQITLALEKDRRMGDEYKNRNKRAGEAELVCWAANTKHVPEWVQTSIIKKAQRYRTSAADIHLLIYVNIPAHEHNYHHIRSYSSGISQEFESVWCINGEGFCCIKESFALPQCRGWKSTPGCEFS